MSAMGSDAVAPFQDPHGRCDCINSPFAKAVSLGPNMAVCFDGNCHIEGQAYFTQDFLNAQEDTADGCSKECGGLSQVCIALDNSTCEENASNIDGTCGAGTSTGADEKSPDEPVEPDAPDDGDDDGDDGGNDFDFELPSDFVLTDPSTWNKKYVILIVVASVVILGLFLRSRR